jgi:hypothetical protein
LKIKYLRLYGYTGGEGRNRPSLVFHKPLEINRLWHR